MDELWDNMVEFDLTNSTNSSFYVFDLLAGNEYDYYILCEDTLGNRMTSSHFVRLDLNSTL